MQPNNAAKHKCNRAVSMSYKQMLDFTEKEEMEKQKPECLYKVLGSIPGRCVEFSRIFSVLTLLIMKYNLGPGCAPLPNLIASASRRD